MTDFTIIKEIVIILAFAILILFISKKINVPSIVGLLIAGVVIGPFGLQLIEQSERIQVLAEIGVVMLMFSIGLELSISKLLEMKKLLLRIAIPQVLVTIIVFAIIFSFLNVELNKAIFYGMLIAISSTSIILKIFLDKNELDTPHAKIGVVVSIFQDIMVVPFLLLVPILGSSEPINFGPLMLKLFFAFGSVGVIILLAKFLIPKILYQIANLRIREVFTIGILLLILGTAYITQSLGMTLGIGAFIAGLIISDSEYSHQVVAEALPFKDAFNSLFFISVGMLLNLQFVVENNLLVIILVVGIIFIKGLIVTLLVLFTKFPIRTSLLSGFALAQIGEFAFVLSIAGAKFNLLDTFASNAFLASSIFTMILAPFLYQLAPLLSKFISSKDRSDISEQSNYPNSFSGHVVIVGYGLNGKNLARVLKETGISYVVIELNPEIVLMNKQLGENIIYGDVTKKQIMREAFVHQANIIVFAISDPTATKIGLKNVEQLNPKIISIVRTRYLNEINEFISLGADEVIPEEFETSLQIFARVLARYHIPLNIIMKQIGMLRSESYSLMRSTIMTHKPFIQLDEILAAGLTETFYVAENNIFVGKSIKEIDLRAKTDATIIAIVRGDTPITNIGPNELILAKDTLVITGTHKSVDDAINYLSNNLEQEEKI